jgi:uncharacterized protein (DUF433 family)
MTLPDFLEYEDGGFIRLSGHRIGLHHVVRLYNEGYSVEQLAAHYPTLPLSLLHKTIGFYLENQGEVDAYCAAEQKEIERLMAQPSSGPSLAELGRRLAAMQIAETKGR